MTKKRRSRSDNSGCGMTDQFTPEGKARIKKRIDDLFREVKQGYTEIFRGNEEITLSDRGIGLYGL